MSFTSPLYYAFIALTLIIYFNVPMRWRGYLLLIASYIFYTSYNPKYIFFILVTTIVSFFCATKIQKSSSKLTRNFALGFALAVELGMLGFTKYWNALHEATHLISAIDIIVPLGISFYTFQSIGYLVDVYREETRAEENLGKYALFISFFPHLLAGPIETSQKFLPQIQQEKIYDPKKLSFGLMLIAIGLFKKLVIADRIKPIVNFVFDSPAEHVGSSVALAAFLARYQIYCDFSGYTDIAIGSALMFGYDLSPNFNRPFFSRSISEYWQRWHMTLTNWIRNYIFYPMLTSRLRILGIGGITLSTFLILGLWHGLTVNFILYGLIQGLLVLADLKTKSLRQKFYQASGLSSFPRILNCISIAVTFFILVVPPTILFRSVHFTTAKTLFSNLLKKAWSVSDLSTILQSHYFIYCLTIASVAIVAMELMDWVQKNKFNVAEYIWQKSNAFFYVTILLIFLLIMMFGKLDVDGRFIYTQF